MVVRLGDLNLEEENDGAKPQTVNVASVTVHPNYKPPQIYHDIALIKLARKVTFDKNLRPACLQVKREVYADKVVATGWGSTNYGMYVQKNFLLCHFCCNFEINVNLRSRVGKLAAS